MRIGFTGTRRGLSQAQSRQLATVLSALSLRPEDEQVPEFHHGAAIGADTQAAEAATALGYSVVPHPAGSDPLARNRRIVATADLLIAAPSDDKEQLRSGTWATVRYARAAGKPVVMLSRGRP